MVSKVGGKFNRVCFRFVRTTCYGTFFNVESHSGPCAKFIYFLKVVRGNLNIGYNDCKIINVCSILIVIFDILYG